VPFRDLVKSSKALTCLYYVVDDIRAGRRLRRGDIATDSGRRHASQRVDESLAYIRRVYSDYLSYARIDRMAGRVCEIGPGDNFGVALMALGCGAREVVAIDRFYSRRDEDYQSHLYERLVRETGWRHLFDGPITEKSIRGLDYRPGEPAETFFRDQHGSFDFIVSRAVLEHLYDPLGALDDMERSLAPGGTLIHRVDLRDHGMFANLHPLTFLTVGDHLYRRMTRNAGRPNRVLQHRYRDWLAQSSLDGEILVTRLAGVAQEVGPAPWDALCQRNRDSAVECVRKVRGDLASEFAALSDECLAVSGLVLVARKHGDVTHRANELEE
jgi:SAM-dependent methyltransferase